MPTVEELEKQISGLKEQLAQTEAKRHIDAREAEVGSLMEAIALPGADDQSVDIVFSEPGEKEEKAKVGWKQFLVSLPEKQMQAFKGLMDGHRFVKAEPKAAGGFNFSEFDNKGAPENLSEGDGVVVEMKDALSRARNAYMSGSAMSKQSSKKSA